MKIRVRSISAIDQNADMQLQAFKRAGCNRCSKTKEFLVSPTKRPASPLPEEYRRRRYPNRLEARPSSRSLRDLIAMVKDLNHRGVHFKSVTEEINTSTAGGKLTFHIFGALADFGRSLITERTREGMKAAPGATLEHAQVIANR